jgi:iron complex outermembrane receptor protein
MNKPTKLALISLGYLTSWLVVHSAGAQQLPAKSAADNGDNSGELQEIVVSSRKRRESLLDAPVVETVVTQEQLAQSQVHDISTLAVQVPGLVLGDQIGAIGPGISIRGIGTTAENATIDQSVSLNVDGLQLSQGLAYKSALFDLGQVEVLKGPQALFFGKNSPGGVISFRSADPTNQTELIVNSGYEIEAKEKYGDVIVSGPVTDSLKLRLSAHYSNDDGYFRNLDMASPGFGTDTPPTRYYNADQNWVVRGTVLFNPSDSYDARLKVNVDHDYTDYVGPQVADCPYGKTSFTGLPIFDQNEDCTLNRNSYLAYMNPSAFPGIRNGGVPYYLSNQKFGTLEQNLHAGELTFTSVTGVYAVDQESVDNGSGTSGIATLSTNNDFSIRQYTEEARLASNFTQSQVNFVAGVFYQHEDMMNHVRLDLNDEIPGVPLPGYLIRLPTSAPQPLLPSATKKSGVVNLE